MRGERCWGKRDRVEPGGGGGGGDMVNQGRRCRPPMCYRDVRRLAFGDGALFG